MKKYLIDTVVGFVVAFFSFAVIAIYPWLSFYFHMAIWPILTIVLLGLYAALSFNRGKAKGLKFLPRICSFLLGIVIAYVAADILLGAAFMYSSPAVP